ncbi:MAG: class I SAM-dependent methyltransferase [Thermodesulfobacteriota bacterium]
MLRLLKSIFYNFFPSAHISTFIRFLYLKRFLKNKSFSKILDAGCGPGLFTFFLAKRFPQAQVIGCDISRDDIEFCNREKINRKIDNVSFVCCDLFELKENEEYDLIYSIDVLEHISWNQKVMENIYHALQSEGIFYLAMPSEKDHRYLLPERFFRKYIEWSIREHTGDQYELGELCFILKEIGFKIILAKYAFGIWGKLAWELDMLMERHRNLKRLSMPLLLFLCFLDTLWKNKEGSYALLIIARKAD